jgi:hypothetical protein
MDDQSHPVNTRARQWRQAHLRLPDDLHQRLEQKAKASERTLAGEMRLRLEQRRASNDAYEARRERLDYRQRQQHDGAASNATCDEAEDAAVKAYEQRSARMRDPWRQRQKDCDE